MDLLDKQLLTIIIISFAGMFSCVVWTMIPNKEQRELSGKILKDAEGNYYKVEHKIGDTFTLEVINTEDLF